MSVPVRQARVDLPGYFKGISERIDLQAKQLTPIIVHSGEMGDNDHSWFAELLRQYLPSRFGVDTGFVINSESDKASADFFATSTKPRTQDKSIGPQTDILLLDTLHNAPFCVEKTFTVCPVEMVLGAIEVTRDLNATKLTTDLGKLARVRELAATKKYMEVFHSAAHRTRPLSFVVGLDGSLSESEMVDQISNMPDDLRPNGILLMNKALYIRKPYQVELMRYNKDHLFHFIALLRQFLTHCPYGVVDSRAYLGPEAEVIIPTPQGLSSSSANPQHFAEFDQQSG